MFHEDHCVVIENKLQRASLMWKSPLSLCNNSIKGLFYWTRKSWKYREISKIFILVIFESRTGKICCWIRYEVHQKGRKVVNNSKAKISWIGIMKLLFTLTCKATGKVEKKKDLGFRHINVVMDIKYPNTLISGRQMNLQIWSSREKSLG